MGQCIWCKCQKRLHYTWLEREKYFTFGSEGFGIKAKTLENSDFRFKVKMNDNIESLNISNTVSVVCHHVFQSIKQWFIFKFYCLFHKFILKKHLSPHSSIGRAIDL